MDKFQKFSQQFPVLKFKKGTIVVTQGEIPRTAFIISSGLVKIYNISNEGDEKLVDFGIKQDIFPDSWVFGKSTAALYFYEALIDCSLYIIPRQRIVTFIDEDTDMQRVIMDKYISGYISQTLRVNALTNSHSTAKLLHTLRYLCIRFGKNVTTDLVELGVYLTHEQFSKLVGLSRETTSKTIFQLRKNNIIVYKKGRIFVDLTKLSAAIGDTDFDSLQINNGLKLSN